jgi:hypothetical protein
MKKLLLKRLILIFVFSAFTHTLVEAQSNWNINGNSGIVDTNFIGTTDSNIVKIKTNNIDRIIVGANNMIQFKGTAIFDSIKIAHGFIYSDSIRCRVLHVGDSSMTLATLPGGGGPNQNNIMVRQETFEKIFKEHLKVET